MDWTFWVAAVVIVGLLIATRVLLHESRWSRRPRREEPEPEPEPDQRSDPEAPGPPPS